jgi:hypothetical protein
MLPGKTQCSCNDQFQSPGIQAINSVCLILRLQYRHYSPAVGAECIESIAVQPEPVDDLIFRVLGQVFGQERGVAEVGALQVVQEVTQVDEREGHNYCDS